MGRQKPVLIPARSFEDLFASFCKIEKAEVDSFESCDSEASKQTLSC